MERTEQFQQMQRPLKEQFVIVQFQVIFLFQQEICIHEQSNVQHKAMTRQVIQSQNKRIAQNQNQTLALGNQEQSKATEKRNAQITKREQGTKDLSKRVIKKFEKCLKAYGKSELFNKIFGDHKNINLGKLNQFYKNPQLRKQIAKYFQTGRYRRQIISSKRKMPITTQKKTNSARNLLKNFMFDGFVFIQGGSINRSFLNKPINQNMMYKNEHCQKESRLNKELQNEASYIQSFINGPNLFYDKT